MKHFSSLGALGKHFERLALGSHEVVDHLAAASVAMIAQRARDDLGHYQGAHAPFARWEKLADSTLATHASLGVGASPLLVTGQLYASIGSGAEGATGVAGSTSPIMVYQEFGTSKIPARSVLGMAAVQSRAKMRSAMGATLAAYLASKGWRRRGMKLEDPND